MSFLYKTLISFSIVIALFILPIKGQAFAKAISIPQISSQDFFVLGVNNTKLGHFKQAVENFTQAIALDANLSAAYSNRCLVYMQLGDYQQAQADCTQALQLDPKNAEVYLNRGLAYQRQQQYQAAIADYNQVIKLKPHDLRGYYNRGLTYFDLQNYQQSLLDYNQAISQNLRQDSQELATVYNDRGLAQFQLGNISAANLDFSLAIRLGTDDSRAYYNRGCICHRLGKYTDAIRDFTLALQQNPHQTDSDVVASLRGSAYVNRGLARYQLGYQQAAFEDLQKGAQCFCKQGEMLAYHQTLKLLEKLRQHSKSVWESEIG
jgi:tetratricopeptide (TPR) repeat protein